MTSIEITKKIIEENIALLNLLSETLQENADLKENKELKWTKFSEKRCDLPGWYIVLTKTGYRLFRHDCLLVDDDDIAWLKIPEFK